MDIVNVSVRVSSCLLPRRFCPTLITALAYYNEMVIVILSYQEIGSSDAYIGATLTSQMQCLVCGVR